MRIKTIIKFSLLVIFLSISFLSGFLVQFALNKEEKVYVRIHDYTQIISRDIANISDYGELGDQSLQEKISSDTMELLNMVGLLLKSIDERPDGHVKLAVDTAFYNMPKLEDPNYLKKKKAEAFDIEGLEYLISFRE